MLFDTNVLIDIVEDDPDWSDWSVTRLHSPIATHHPPSLAIGHRKIRPLTRCG